MMFSSCGCGAAAAGTAGGSVGLAGDDGAAAVGNTGAGDFSGVWRGAGGGAITASGAVTDATELDRDRGISVGVACGTLAASGNEAAAMSTPTKK